MTKLTQKYNFFFLVFGFFTWVLSKWADLNPYFVEKYYSQKLFIGIKNVQDIIFGWINFPFIYILMFLILLFVIIPVRYLFEKNEWFKSICSISSRLVLIYALFLWVWGFNYARLPIEKHLNMEVLGSLTLKQLQSELDFITDLVNQTSSKLENELNYKDSRQKIKESVWSFMQKNKILFSKRIQSKELIPGTLLVWSTAGMYFPFTGESNVDSGMEEVQMIAVLAHEFAHGLGWGDEGTCNFIGTQALIDSENINLNYAGALSYWRLVAKNMRYLDEDRFQTSKSKLSLKAKNDLNSIYKSLNKFPDLMPNLRLLVYDNYLKSNGVEHGILSYNRGVNLCYSYRKNNESTSKTGKLHKMNCFE